MCNVTALSRRTVLEETASVALSVRRRTDFSFGHQREGAMLRMTEPDLYRTLSAITVAAAWLDGVKGWKCAAENAHCKGAYSRTELGCRM